MQSTQLKKILYFSILAIFFSALPKVALAKKGGELSGGGNKPPKKEKSQEEESRSDSSRVYEASFPSQYVREFCHRDIEIVQNTRCIEEWSGLCTSSTLTRDIEEFEADFDIYWEKDSNSPEDWILYINDQTQVYEIPPCNLDSFQNIDFEREAGGELSGGGKKKRNS